MRKFCLYLCIILTSVVFMGVIHASDDSFIEVASEAALDSCITKEKTCRLTKDIQISKQTEIDGEVYLDLNGKSLIADPALSIPSGLISIQRGGHLIVNDSSGNGKISTGDNSNIYGAINLLEDTKEEDGKAKLTVNGGTIEGFYYGIVCNGNRHGTEITINGGEVKGLNEDDSTGIFQPQKGTLTINGGTISGATGIEIRSGNLTVNDGTIRGVGSFKKMVNGNGTTTDGVGIAVAQHTTKNPISVIINDGNISGEYAFYEWNPHRNAEEYLDTINISINGGDFTSKDGIDTVYSEDFTSFIHGGTFNSDVDEYKADDTVSSTVNNITDLGVKNNKTYVTLGIFLVSILIFGAVIYKMKI